MYDITGRKVRELVNGRIEPGAHSAVWNGLDESGVPAASGIYFARLRDGEMTSTRRMILMK